MYNDTYLSHYGVPGMKWGVRTKDYSSHATNVYRKKASKYEKQGNKRKADRFTKYANKSQKLDNDFKARVNAASKKGYYKKVVIPASILATPFGGAAAYTAMNRYQFNKATMQQYTSNAKLTTAFAIGATFANPAAAAGIPGTGMQTGQLQRAIYVRTAN